MWGREGVTLQMVPLTREKNLMKKKIGIDQGAGSLEADRRTEKEKKKRKCRKDPQPARQREKKKKTKETKKKKVEKKEIYKGRNTHSPLPHCTRI